MNGLGGTTSKEGASPASHQRPSRKDSNVKRALAALVMLGISAATAAPSAAATTVYGSAQLKYTVNATAAVSILPSAAGNCSAAVAEGANATLTFGGITPPAAGYTGCYYQNAVSVGVQSNDSLGVQVMEYLDVAPAGTAVCVFPLGAANTFNALPTASGASGNPAAYTGAACPTVNSIAGKLLTALGAATAGTGFGAAGAPAGGTSQRPAPPPPPHPTARG